MASLWNFLFSFSWDKGLTTYTVEELNNRLKELDLDKHLDSLEKAFEVQKTLIDKLKAENDALKKELREIRKKLPESERTPLAGSDVIGDGTQNKGPLVPYPEMRSVKCLVKWSALENNATESRVIERVRCGLAAQDVELEAQPWAATGRNSMYPVIVFCPGGCDPSIIPNSDQGPHGPVLLLAMHERDSSEPVLQSADSFIPSHLRTREKVHLAVDISFYQRRLLSTTQNEDSLQQLINFLRDQHD